MKLILITERKLKILLSGKELDGLGISCDEMDYSNTGTRRVFWYLLDEAKRATGFDAASARVFIQIYPSGDGGCEMYVSKLGDAGSGKGQSGSRGRGERSEELTVRRKRRREERIYRFEDMEDMLSACRELQKRRYGGISSAYDGGEELGGYYLKLECEPGECAPLEEYGERRSSAGLADHISEHCREICRGDAVGALAEF